MSRHLNTDQGHPAAHLLLTLPLFTENFEMNKFIEKDGGFNFDNLMLASWTVEQWAICGLARGLWDGWQRGSIHDAFACLDGDEFGTVVEALNMVRDGNERRCLTVEQHEEAPHIVARNKRRAENGWG